jgi:multidrug efflux system outer membrane protein
MKRLRSILILGASTALLAACATGPDYVRPAPTGSDSGAFVASASTAFTQEAPPADWWRLFDDPALDGLVTEALAANKDVAVARANLAQVRASLGEARAGRLPSTTTSAGAQRVRAQNGATGDFAETDAYSAGFDVSYEVDLFGRVGRGIEAARADADAAAAALEVTRVSVAAETARAYADACAAGAQIEIANQTIGLQQQTYDLTKRMLDVGQGSAMDVASAATLVETSRATLPTLEASRSSALFRLAVLTGKPPAQASEIARTCKTIPQVASAIPVGDGSALLKRRPDVRQAERQLAAATARIGVATAALYPTVTLGGGIATSGARAGDLGDDFTFNVGPLISWSFPNIAVAKSRIAQAGAVADGALATFEKANLVALQEAETALDQYARELQRRAALTRARDQSALAARLARQRYDAGVDSFLQVLDAERTQAGLEAQLAQSQALVATYQVAVFKALAGGWNSEA